MADIRKTYIGTRRTILRWALGLGAVACVLGGVALGSLSAQAQNSAPVPKAVSSWGGPGPAEVHLVSLFWPPYVGKDLPYGGTDAQLVREAYQRAGLSVSIDYMPWARALAQFQKGEVDGIFPEYAERGANDSSCLMSQAYKTTRLAFAETPTRPLKWQKLEDLARYRLGVVRDYYNTTDFDALIAEGVLKVELGPDDISGLRMVAAQRLDGAVIDPAVFQYLTENDASLQPILDMLQVNPKPLGEKTLHICFARSPRGQALRDVFHRNLVRE